MPKTKTFTNLFVFVSLFTTLFLANDIYAADAKAPDYVIGPHDALNIFVWREEELTRDVTVMSDGKISFPLIGSIVAQGKSVAQLRDAIIGELKKFIDAPEVTVIVNTSSRRIYTIGNVTRPGPYPLAANMTVLQALSTAGGFSEWADTKKIVVIRRSDGKEVQHQFNYKDFISGKKLEQNIVLEPNDTIVVP